jgi:hypothetical protein
MELIKVYENISEVCRLFNVPRSSITKAARNNTIYMNYRWNLVERNDDPTNVDNVQETTKLKKIQNLGYIAKLNSSKNEIINVYLDRKTASIKNGYDSICYLDYFVKTGKLVDSHYYILYDTLDEILKTEFLRKNNIKEVVLYKNGGVGQYKENTLVKEFKSKYDCHVFSKIGNKSICKALETGKSYNGYNYIYLPEKTML